MKPLFEKPRDADYFMGILDNRGEPTDIWQSKDQDKLIFAWDDGLWGPIDKESILNWAGSKNDLVKGMTRLLEEQDDDPSVSPNSRP